MLDVVVNDDVVLAVAEDDGEVHIALHGDLRAGLVITAIALIPAVDVLTIKVSGGQVDYTFISDFKRNDMILVIVQGNVMSNSSVGADIGYNTGSAGSVEGVIGIVVVGITAEPHLIIRILVGNSDNAHTEGAAVDIDIYIVSVISLLLNVVECSAINNEIGTNIIGVFKNDRVFFVYSRIIYNNIAINTSGLTINVNSPSITLCIETVDRELGAVANNSVLNAIQYLNIFERYICVIVDIQAMLCTVGIYSKILQSDIGAVLNVNSARCSTCVYAGNRYSMSVAIKSNISRYSDGALSVTKTGSTDANVLQQGDSLGSAALGRVDSSLEVGVDSAADLGNSVIANYNVAVLVDVKTGC